VKLGPADAEKLRTAFRTREAEAERARKALVRAVERLKTALRTQPFDKQQLRAAIAEVRTVRTVYEQEMQEIVLSAVAMMSHEGRVALVK